jgi:hypothetical protein
LRYYLGAIVVLVSGCQLTSTPSMAQSNQPSAKPTIDFNYYRARVEPIFLEKRAGHTRCYVCHAESNNSFRLEKLSPGSHVWSEDQSRRNFEVVLKLVNIGDPDNSRLLQQPLAPEGGGNVFHSGGRQFMSKNDLRWKTIARWINGAKLDARTTR